MSRVIKFRGISTETGEWVYGNLIIDGFTALILNGVAESTDEYIAIEDWRPVNIKSVGQYTGVDDNEGTEIYENDVLSSPHFTDVAGRNHTLEHSVVWSEKLHGWFLLNCGSKNPDDGSIQLFVAKNEEITVVGNTLENPELINQGLHG